jgi:hypothetical protein
VADCRGRSYPPMLQLMDVLPALRALTQTARIPEPAPEQASAARGRFLGALRVEIAGRESEAVYPLATRRARGAAGPVMPRPLASRR